VKQAVQEEVCLECFKEREALEDTVLGGYV
jgi:hypothetical protein